MAKNTTTSIIVDTKYLGREPEFGSDVMSQIELIRSLNWYNYFKDTDVAKEYLNAYANSNNLKLQISLHDTNTFGWLARMISRGAKLPEYTLEQFNKYINKIKKVKKVVEASSNTTETREVNRLSIWLPEIEEMVDNYNQPFNCYNFISTNNIPQTYVKQIIDYYQPQADEVRDAYDKKDKDLVEGYSNFSRTELKAFLLRLNSIIEDCQKFLGNTKKERKPRKKRAKSVDTILKHFKYLKHDDNLKLSSEDPSKIIGCSALYVLNTKYNTLTMFIAADDSGLTISRTSIANFDQKKSMTKRVGRKLNDVVKAINEGTKRSRVKVLDSVKSDPATFTDRLNENSLILKVDK